MKRYFATLFVLFCLTVPLAQALAADKVVIGVGEITTSMRSWVRGSSPVAFQAMLETQLIKSNKFDIIERERLDQILKEQAMSEAGLIEGDNAPGGIDAVDYLIYGTVTKLGEKKSGGSFGGVGVGNKSYEMGIDIRIVDTASGKIITAESVERKIKSGSSFAMKGASHRSDSGDPIADVQRLVAMDIAAKMVTTIYPIKIIAIQKDGTVILNYGDSILQPGDLLKVFELGEGFVDPDTGETLGSEEVQMGILEVGDVQSKFSKATIKEGDTITKGNIARKMDPDEMKAAKKGKKKKRKRL